MVGLVSTRRRGNVINRDLIIKLSDTAGVAKFEIKDSDNFPIFQVDSKGNVAFKGRQKRTLTN